MEVAFLQRTYDPFHQADPKATALTVNTQNTPQSEVEKSRKRNMPGKENKNPKKQRTSSETGAKETGTKKTVVKKTGIKKAETKKKGSIIRISARPNAPPSCTPGLR